MSSVHNTFANFAAQFQANVQGEEGVIVTVKGGDPVPLKVIVLRDRLNTRATDGNERQEYSVEVQIPMELYPADQPVIHADKIKVAVRKGDEELTERTVSGIIGQVSGMWYLGLD